MKLKRSTNKLIFVILIIHVNLLKSIKAIDQVSLKCDEFERSQDYKDIYCTITNFKVTHSQQVKIDYNSHQTNNIKFMKFYDSTILYIPHKLFEIFENLKNLDVAYSDVIDIPRNTFIGADTLSYLNISHNNITEITTSVFIGAASLLRLDLSYNSIIKINEHAFKGLTILDRLSLSNNKIKILDKNLFIDNQYLESLALDNNEIENLDSEIFIKLIRLRDIDLTNNKLKQIQSNLFENSYNLDTLLISGNQLKEFNLNHRNPATLLQLDNNQLKSLIINGTKNIKAENNNISVITSYTPMTLEKLLLSNNSINNIKYIQDFINLISLDLSYNKIGLINVTTFDKLKRLKVLILRNTGIRGITFGTFSKQTNLEILDLSYNNLCTLNLDIFVPYLLKLQEFYIDGNNLTEIRGKMSFSFAFPALSTLGLSNNNFNCSYLHRIITPIFLSTYVKLHIDRNETNDGLTPHIRGISCHSDESIYSITISTTISNIKENSKILNNNQYQDKQKSLDIQKSLHLSIDRLKIHEKQLEQHLLLMKAFIMIFTIAAVCFMIYKVFKFSTERGDSIVRSISYRSTSSVNTTQSAVE